MFSFMLKASKYRDTILKTTPRSMKLRVLCRRGGGEGGGREEEEEEE
jgi:hypothetical protein